MSLWKDNSTPKIDDNSDEIDEEGKKGLFYSTSFKLIPIGNTPFFSIFFFHKGSENSDTINSQEMHHENETVCDCLKNKLHFDNVVLDTKFKTSVEKIYNLLYTSGFIAEFLSKIVQNNGMYK